jgi:cyclophilin family peptidyl-prolyl cis-trans isomerase
MTPWMRTTGLLLAVLLPVLLNGCSGKPDSKDKRKKSAPGKTASEATPAPEKTAAEATPAPTGKHPADNDPAPRITMKTSHGTLVIELDRTRAPLTVENFLHYAKAGFYDNTLFHRVLKGSVIQGGGFDREGEKKKPIRPPVKNESKTGPSNVRGTISMARLPDPDSATAQFFINVRDNSALYDWREAKPGYTAFGRVVQGLEVADAIQALELTDQGGAFKSCPEEDVVILSVRRE